MLPYSYIPFTITLLSQEAVTMVERQEYMQKLIQWKDRQVIKVVTGVRRCGKSTLLLMFREFLEKNGVDSKKCISINFEDLRYEDLKDYHKLYAYIMEHVTEEGRYYIFLDEIQLVPDFQKAVDSLYLHENVDLYLTGSNAAMLSGELATMLSGRYVEIRMLPLSFREYYELVGGDRKEAFNAYYRKGGFPYAALLQEEAIRRDYLMGIYNTVLLKDIVERKRIADVPLLEGIIRFLADNIGNVVSVKKISDSLTSDGRKTTAMTVDGYVQALKDAFILYEANRYDVKGKQYLRSLEKYYLVDIGLRSLLLGERVRDVGRILENIVYLELLRRGYRVSVGKVDTLEVDFVAESGDERIYYQVSASVLDPATYDREFRPLKRIHDNYPKYVLSMDDLPMGEDGIRQMNIIDFLLE